MRVAYVDCFSGISGDMFLGALVDAGLSPDALRAALKLLPVNGYRLEIGPLTRQGVSGHAVRVRLDDPAGQPTRHLSEVTAIIGAASLPATVIDGACRVFQKLAEAEAAVHGTSVEEVHFHEVGAVDAIVDVVGTVWGLQQLGVERVYASSVPTGSGTVQTAHGLLPIPAPATLALLSGVNAPLRPSPATTELATPTGAALLATLATFSQPAMRVSRVGYGFGQKVMPWANVVRLWLGEVDDTPAAGELGLETDTVIVIEANLDDDLPEIVGAAMETLFAAGALDVFFTAIQMKKNRPGVKLTVLAPPNLAAALSAVVLRETSTLGVRTYPTSRVKTRRWQETVATPWGDVRVKVKEFVGERRAAPEYADCLELSRRAGVPLPEVYQAVNAAAAMAGMVTKPTPRSS
jgi:pyridinium-3,5-bisthiocarboxylic acid mononucleotide nickel chelatase